MIHRATVTSPVRHLEPVAPRVRLHQPYVASTAADAVRRVLESGWLGEGPVVRCFEHELRRHVGSDHVVAVNSGTSALELSVDLAQLRPGDEVISTPMTCPATNLPFIRRNIGIRWADIDPETGNLDAATLEACVTERTKAIVAVHWGGYPCDLAEILACARRHHLVVIEDAAHALGSTYHCAPIGSHGDFVCFSFQAVKMITTGDGGCLVTRRADTGEQARRLRWFGVDREGRREDHPWDADIDVPGYKFQMNDVAAAIGLEALSMLDELVATRRAHAAFYDDRLARIPGIRLMRREADRCSSWWLYTILVENRDGCLRHLQDHGVESCVVQSRNDHYTVFKSCQTPVPLDGVERFSREFLCIPVGPWLTEDDLERVVAVLAAGW